MGLYYELVGRLPHQAVLTGSTTILAAAASQCVDTSGEDTEPPPGTQAPPSPAGPAPQPLLVVVDGLGRLTRFAWLRNRSQHQNAWLSC